MADGDGSVTLRVANSGGEACFVDGVSTVLTSAACVAGQFSAVGSTGCSLCAAGTFSSSAGSSGCGTCPAGSYCLTGSAAATPCGAGRYSSAAGAASDAACEPCAAGRASAVAGATSAATCATCSAGTYQASSGGTACESCPEGQFQTAAGASACERTPQPTPVPSPLPTPLPSALPLPRPSPLPTADPTMRRLTEVTWESVTTPSLRAEEVSVERLTVGGVALDPAALTGAVDRALAASFAEAASGGAERRRLTPSGLASAPVGDDDDDVGPLPLLELTRAVRALQLENAQQAARIRALEDAVTSKL